MDIVKRLRGDYEIDQIFKTTPICHEAADEIERLRKENERLQKTLRTVKHYLVYLDGTIKRTLGEKE